MWPCSGRSLFDSRYLAYACKACDEAAEAVTIRKAPLPAAVIPGGIASAEAIANVINDKFVFGTPPYRQEQYWQRQGVKLSRQTMSNWLLYVTEHGLKQIYEKLQQDLLQEDILHADETEVHVLHEEGKSPQSKSYMWLYRTGRAAKTPIVLYYYERDRRHARPEAFLKGFRGYLHSAERSIKPFVIGRKNFLFANTPKGAEASTILYSLVETAKETGVVPYAYFVYTLTEAANLREAGENEKISKLTPAHLKQQMQIPSNRPQV